MLSTEIVVVMSKTAHDDCALALMFTKCVMRKVRRLQLVAASSPLLSSMQLMSLSVLSRADVVGVALVDVERVPATSSVQRLAILLGGRAEIAPSTVIMYALEGPCPLALYSLDSLLRKQDISRDPRS